jgi:hypothetical protein
MSQQGIVFPPLSFPPPPRRVRRTVGSGCALALPRLFFLPHMILGVMLFLYAPMNVYVKQFGTPVIATVDDCETRQTRKGGIMYLVQCHFINGGKRYDDSRSISQSAFATLHVGDKIIGRTSPLLYFSIRFQNEHFLCPEWSDGPLIIPFFFSIVWNSVVSVFAYRFWIIPYLQRRLLRNGSVAKGAVTSCRSVGRGRRRITYSFENVQRKLFVGSQDIENDRTAKAGDPCSIFYSLKNPKRSIAYEFSGLRIFK